MGDRMKTERRILHVDMDAYFASLEVQSCPHLKGKPVVVGALPGQRGVVVSASYEARAFGVRAAMPIPQAKRICPSAELVPCHPSLYIHTSRRILEHLLTITSKVEMFSIDEAFIDITDMVSPYPGEGASWSKVEEIAYEIAGSIERTFNLTCTVGAGPNKLIAKMASKLAKPAGVKVLSKEAFRREFWHRPLDDMFGIGEKTAASLMIYGIEKIGELAQAPQSFLRGRFGVYGEGLHTFAWGEDETPVVPCHDRSQAKSMGHEHTLQADISSIDQGLGLLLALTEKVAEDLREESLSGRRVTIKIRHSDFSTQTRQRMMSFSSQETRDIYRTAKALFLDNYCGEGIRLLGVTVGDLVQTGGMSQLALFPEDRRYTKYLKTVDEIRGTHGKTALQAAGAMSVVNM